MKRFWKISRIVGIVLLCVLLGALVFIITLAFIEPLVLGEFYESAEKAFATPGRHEDFIQQGITHSGGRFLTSGYMGDGTASRVYITYDCPHGVGAEHELHEGIDHSAGDDGRKFDTTFVMLSFADGTDFKGHSGGITVYNDYVYIADGDGVIVYSFDDIINSENGAAVAAIGKRDLGVHASFVHVEEDKLYVGEFYRPNDYETDQSHHLTTPSGAEHKAIIFSYDLDAADDLNKIAYDYNNAAGFGIQGVIPTFGIPSTVPLAAYSIPNQIQGMCFTDNGSIVLSESYGLALSSIQIYANPLPSGEFDLNGVKIPLCYLDEPKSTISAPPMTEELVNVSGRIYVMNESASNKYIFGKLLRAISIYSLEIDESPVQPL